MTGLRGMFLAAVAAVVATLGVRTASANPIVNILQDNGSRVTTTPTQTSTNPIAPLYGSAAVTVTQVTSGWKLTFVPNSAFFAQANNLAGPTTQTLAGALSFDITFDNAVNLTTNVFEGGIYGVSGSARATAGAVDVPSGLVVQAYNPLGTDFAETKQNSFWSSAVANYDNVNGTWALFDQVTGFSATHTKYRVTVDNDLLAQAFGNTPGFASIAKKTFSIVFTFDGSAGGNPPSPEPASLGVLGVGALALLARRRK